MPAEAVLQKLVIGRLNRIDGVFVWRQNTGAFKVHDRFIRFGIPGQADVTGIVRGKRLEIECKSQKGKQSPEQRLFEKRITEHGGFYYIVQQLEDVDALEKAVQSI